MEVFRQLIRCFCYCPSLRLRLLLSLCPSLGPINTDITLHPTSIIYYAFNGLLLFWDPSCSSYLHYLSPMICFVTLCWAWQLLCHSFSIFGICDVPFILKC